MGFFTTDRTEGLAYAKYILQNKPGAKIGVLYGNDDAGKEYLASLHDGLGDKTSALIVKEVSYLEGTSPAFEALKEEIARRNSFRVKVSTILILRCGPERAMPHSYRNATIGSMRIVRRAGM